MDCSQQNHAKRQAQAAALWTLLKAGQGRCVIEAVCWYHLSFSNEAVIFLQQLLYN